jgi:hypothetical protein
MERATSNIKKCTIISNKTKQEVSLLGKGGVDRLYYYESILQDSIKIDVIFNDAGNAINEKSVVEGLPLVGTEEVDVEIEDVNQRSLKVKMYVNKVTPLGEDSMKSKVNITLVSDEFITNEVGKSRVNKRFDGKISDHIQKLMIDNLKSKKQLNIEETENNYNFIGNNRKPIYVINWLSKKSIPTKDGKKGQSAGFLWFETSNGYNFKSIDSLFAQKQKKSYIFTNTTDKNGKIPAGYDGSILQHNPDNRINAQEKFKMGTYGTRIVLFDPFNCYYEVSKQTADETKGGTKLAAKDLPKLNEKFGTMDDFTRTTYMLIDKGTLPTGDSEGQIEKSKEQNFDSKSILNQSIRRYNQIFSAKEEVTIDADYSLHAGDAIFIDTPSIQKDTGSDVNREFGGLYIISDLCHFISPKASYTKLNLIRDSFGRKGNHTTSV